MAKRDFYDVLGVKREASAEEIKKAYRNLARKFHPDLHPGDKKAEKNFKEVQEAYDVLSDQDKRDQYDRFGNAAFEQGGPGPRSQNYTWSNQGSPEMQFDFGEGGLGDILGGLFGGRGRKGGGAGGTQDIPGDDIETELSIPFRTAVMGGDLDITISGNGPGQRLTVTIPPGVNDGARLRLAGKGRPSPTKGRSGDLYVLVRVEPHGFFTRNGRDVYLDAPISISEAVLGTSMDVPTLEGTVTVAVPPGASSGQKLRIRGKGGPSKDGERGDQYVQIKVVSPKSVDDESKRLIEQFARRNPMNPRENAGWR